MTPLLLTHGETVAAHAGLLTEIWRPIDGLPGPASRGYMQALTSGEWEWSPDGGFDHGVHRVRHAFGALGALLFGQERWRSWVCAHNEDWDEDLDVQSFPAPYTYVAYEATPRRGYRPVPDRAAITYLDESTPLDHNRELLGPWQSAADMPLWASRFAFRLRRVEARRASLSTGEGPWLWFVEIERVNRPNGAPMPPTELQTMETIPK